MQKDCHPIETIYASHVVNRKTRDESLMPLLPRIFIGSSTEGLDYAYAIQKNLEHCAECTVWTQGIFALTSSILNELIRNLRNFDFGIFVLSPDDKLETRGHLHSSPRDNVVFELGLFIAALGRERTFMIVPRTIMDLHLPTDLLGIVPASFDPGRSDKNWLAALGPACFQIQKAVESVGRLATGDNTEIRDQQIECAAAICFRRVDAAVEFLLHCCPANTRIDSIG
jgi:predicted nucleotide-binding protein